MANPALDYSASPNPGCHLSKDTFVFDGNSQTAHLIARTILVNDPHQKFALIPKQNTTYFGINVPSEYLDEKFVLLSQTGQVLSGTSALDFINERLKLTEMYQYH